MKKVTGILSVLIWGLVCGSVPAEPPAEALEVLETDATVTVTQAGRTVVVYNKRSPALPDGVDRSYQRSGFLHPVASPSGQVVTGLFPADHRHQDGVFTAWVKTTWNGRAVDFWNLAGGTGRVLHQRVLSTFQDEESAGFEVRLLHRVVQPPVADVLSEHWKVTVHRGGRDYHCFDLETTQTALTDVPLIVEKYHYGGVALRGPVAWLASESSSAAGFLNDHGSDRHQGNHQKARWVSMTGPGEQGPVAVSVLCHADNFRAPQAARLHPSKPYFCFAPCVDDAFVIDRRQPYHAKFRCLVTDTAPDADWLNQQWQDWCGDGNP